MNWRFIHIPKTGGTSIRYAFNDERRVRVTHFPANWTIGMDYNVRTVAVIRHPLDRLVSIHAWYFGSTNGFSDWLDSDWEIRPRIELSRPDNGEVVIPAAPPVVIPLTTHQSWWICSDTYLIPFDSLQDGVDAWCDQAGIPRRTLERRNASDREPEWRDLMTDAQIERFSDIFAQDLSTYGYLCKEFGSKHRDRMAEKGQ